jgi:DNA adenine methylase
MSDSLLGVLFGMEEGTKDKRESYQRAPFGWPGGKSESLKHILDKLPYRRVFVEAFGGSGVVSINRKKSVLDVYNDRYGGIVAFYRCLRNSECRQKLIERLNLTPHAREEFVWSRDTWDKVEDDVERAARWFVSVQMSFGGLGRNFARTVDSKPPIKNNLDLFNPVGNRFREIQIENLDWKQCLKDYDSYDTVFYLDPPYYKSDGGIYEHTLHRHEQHVELLETIFRTKGFVALSGYANDLYDKYNWSERHTWDVSVTIKANAFNDENHQVDNVHTRMSKRAQEVLWIKN